MEEAVQGAGLVLLAVKPQNMVAVCTELRCDVAWGGGLKCEA